MSESWSGSQAQKLPTISFEFFPAKDRRHGAQSLGRHQPACAVAPNFVSVTYGAGGSTRERTHTTIARILTRDFTPACGASHMRGCHPLRYR